MIRILLAEDQTIIRRGIAALLAMTPDIRVVAEAEDGAEALREFERLGADVLLLDVVMPKIGGIEVVHELRRKNIAVPALLLTTFDEDRFFLEAVRAGANGFLLKDVSLERLEAAIRAAHEGKSILQPALTERIARRLRETGTAFDSLSEPDQLTPREREVLRLIAGGYSNREIAEMLSLSQGSVKNHTSNILSKLGARDRTRAVLRGIELGML